MATIHSENFGLTKEGRRVTAFHLENGAGMSVRILDFGGTVQALTVPDRSGSPIDVVLGYDDVSSYEKGTCFYGGIVGRFANRIAHARFVLNGKEYVLEKSNGEDNHVHGIFNKRMFDACPDKDSLVLRYLSPSMEEGFPGDLSVEVRYRLREDSALEITYAATTTEPTVLNLTNHSYFNLNGQDGSTVYDP